MSDVPDIEGRDIEWSSGETVRIPEIRTPAQDLSECRQLLAEVLSVAYADGFAGCYQASIGPISIGRMAQQVAKLDMPLDYFRFDSIRSLIEHHRVG